MTRHLSPGPSKRPFPQQDSSIPATGLLGWLENTRVQLPLQAVDCRFDICGMIAEVETCQVFVQNNTRVLNCVYVFALPAGAAIHQCVIDVNGRTISARAEERGKARRLVADKAAKGHRTALVELERDNVFTLTLGNCAPGDRIMVRLAWFQAVDVLGSERSLTIPFTPGVRYIPGSPLLRENRGVGIIDDTDLVPDASRISPPRIDGDHPDSAALFVHGTIRHAEGSSVEVSSPSDLLRVEERPGVSTISLAHADTASAFPDVDLVIRWTETCTDAGKSAGTGWITNSGKGYDHALLHLVAPVAEKPVGFSQDIYLLVDRSGSMNGHKWQQATAALKGFVECLDNEERVFITFFESDHQDFAERPLPARELKKDREFRSIEKIGTAGGTELLPALQHQLEVCGRHSQGRPATFVLITDGQVGNETEVFNALEGCPDLRLHTFGIDTNVNDAFLRELARRHRGTCCLRTPSDDIVAAVTQLGAMISRPALRSLAINEGWEIPGGLPTDLYSGQSLTIPVRRKHDDGNHPRELALTAEGESKTEITIEIALHPSETPAIELLWVRERIDHLLARGLQDEAVRMAIEHNLICDGVAFVAWDDAEKVALSGPVDTLVQPSPAPSPPMAASRSDEIDSGAAPYETARKAPPAPPAKRPDPLLLQLTVGLLKTRAVQEQDAVEFYLFLSREQGRGAGRRKSSIWIKELTSIVELFHRLGRERADMASLTRAATKALKASEQESLRGIEEFLDAAARLRSAYAAFMRMGEEVKSMMTRLPAPLSEPLERSLHGLMNGAADSQEQIQVGSEDRLVRLIEQKLKDELHTEP